MISENPKYKTGWKIEVRFKIGLHKKDRVILELIQSYFGLGTISKQGKNGVGYRVTRTRDLIKIIDHFNKYSLITQKKGDFILFKQAIALINNKEHRVPPSLYRERGDVMFIPPSLDRERVGRTSHYWRIR